MDSSLFATAARELGLKLGREGWVCSRKEARAALGAAGLQHAASADLLAGYDVGRATFVAASEAARKSAALAASRAAKAAAAEWPLNNLPALAEKLAATFGLPADSISRANTTESVYVRFGEGHAHELRLSRHQKYSSNNVKHYIPSRGAVANLDRLRKAVIGARFGFGSYKQVADFVAGRALAEVAGF